MAQNVRREDEEYSAGEMEQHKELCVFHRPLEG